MPGCRVDISLLSLGIKNKAVYFYTLCLRYLCRKERLYLMNRTTFLQDVYSVVAAIPAGCVVTYGQIASLVGRPQCSRMVGQAMHNVPEELHLPCHRVVNSRGRLVPGWTEQRVLLENEGVRFKANGFVDMKKSQWEFMKEQ